MGTERAATDKANGALGILAPTSALPLSVKAVDENADSSSALQLQSFMCWRGPVMSGFAGAALAVVAVSGSGELANFALCL